MMRKKGSIRLDSWIKQDPSPTTIVAWEPNNDLCATLGYPCGEGTTMRVMMHMQREWLISQLDGVDPMEK